MRSRSTSGGSPRSTGRSARLCKCERSTAHQPRCAGLSITSRKPSPQVQMRCCRNLVAAKARARNEEDQAMKSNLFRLIRFAVLVASIGTFSTSSFSEGTPEQRRACKDDAFRLCRDTIPDVPRITECMHKNQKKLSPACKVFFKPG